MKLQIWQAGEPTEVDLADGVVGVGGGEADDLWIEGLAPSILKLKIDGEQVTVTARAAVKVGEVLFPAGMPRLLLPGEWVVLGDEVKIQRLLAERSAEAREQSRTERVLRSLLSEVDPPAETRAAALTCLTGLDACRHFPLGPEAAVIGRGLEAQIRIRDRAVSRRHARIVRQHDRYQIEDLGGPNGLYVNGKPVERAVDLRSGDVIDLGHSVLRFDGSGESQPEDPSKKEEAPASTAKLQARHADWWVIGAGASLAVTGLLVSWGLSS